MPRKTAPTKISRSYLSAIVFGLLVFQGFSFGVSSAQELAVYPGMLIIAKTNRLSLEERQVEARFAAFLEAQTEAAIGRYKTKYGKDRKSTRLNSSH